MINESFKALFETLFEGGQAELRLVESEDALEGGSGDLRLPARQAPRHHEPDERAASRR